MRDCTEAYASDRFTIDTSNAGVRLDKLLALRYPDQSRQYFQALIEDGHVLLNDLVPKKRAQPSPGDKIHVRFAVKPELDLTPEDIPLDILYEDAHILAVNKPVGMVVHPAPGHWSGTFVNALLFHCKAGELGQADDSIRPGIVHRLDKDTSGVLLAAKTDKAHRSLVEAFSKRTVSKQYLAICTQRPTQTQIVEPIGRHPTRRKEMTVRSDGREAITEVKVLGNDEKLYVVEAYPRTGRTHQIRVHLKYVNAPILGDQVYGPDSLNQKWKATRQLLHAERLTVPHPETGEPISFTAPPPEDMLTHLERLIPNFSQRYR